MSIRGTTPVFDSDKLDNKDSSQYLQQTDILQTTGQSTTDTMSQKAITDALANAGGGGSGGDSGSNVKTYEEVFGDGTSTEFLITHNLNDSYPYITIIEIATGDRYIAQIQYIDANSFKILCDSNYTPANDSMKVIVRGGSIVSIGAVSLKYETLIGNGSTTSFPINHGLGSEYPNVMLIEASTGEYWLANYFIEDKDNITIEFDTAPTANQFKVVITVPSEAVAPITYEETYTFSSTNKTKTVTHNLGYQYPIVQVIQGTELVSADVTYTDENNLVITTDVNTNTECKIICTSITSTANSGDGGDGGGGSSSVTVVQTTGQSTTSVMSQKAVTDSLNELQADFSVSSNPNLLINGDFKIWQRGTSFSIARSSGAGNEKYTADRWYILNSGYQSINITQNSSNYLVIRPSAHMNLVLGQYIEKNSFHTSSGFTLQILASCDSSATIIPSINSINGDTITVNSSSPAWYTSNINTNIGVNSIDFKLNIQGGTELTILAIKLEKNNKATPYCPRTYQEELNDCMRFYEVFLYGALDTQIPYTGISQTAMSHYSKFVVPKRVIPTLIVKNTTGTGGMGRIVYYTPSGWSPGTRKVKNINLSASTTTDRFGLGFEYDNTTEIPLTVSRAEYDSYQCASDFTIAFDAEIYGGAN